MGAASRTVLVILRLLELSTSAVVVGILGYFLSLIGAANAYSDSRLIYAIVVASFSIFVSLVFILPFLYAFLVFPVDFIFSVLWFVAFCLLESITGIDTCGSVWYYNYWGYYWGGFWRQPVVTVGPNIINWSGCASWRAVLAMSFIASFFYLMNAFLGCYVVLKYRDEKLRRSSPGKPLTLSRPPPMEGARREPEGVQAQPSAGDNIGTASRDMSQELGQIAA